MDDLSFQRMINKLDRKNFAKVTWTEFLNFTLNEGIRRETVNDAQLYGYGVKRLTKTGQHHLRTVDQYKGPEKIAEYYIDGMVFIKLKNIRLLLNLFENKEAKLYDLRSLQPIQHLIFHSDYAIPKPKKVDNRGKKTTVPEGNNTTIESMSKTNTIEAMQFGQSMPHDMLDSASVISVNNTVSGINTLDLQNDASGLHVVEENNPIQNFSLEVKTKTRQTE